MNKFTLRFELHSFWQAGTGRGSGAVLDMLAHRDADGLPCLPGRTAKGLLRDVVGRAEDWRYLPPGTTEHWFGSRAPVGEESRLNTNPGILRISDAVLPDALGAFLRQEKRNTSYFNSLCKGFFHPLYATAINPPVEDEGGTDKPAGTAKHKSALSEFVLRKYPS